MNKIKTAALPETLPFFLKKSEKFFPMNLRTLFTVLFFTQSAFFFQSIFAQNEPCFAEEMARKNALFHPELAESREEIHAKITEFAQNFDKTTQSRAVVTIPVVVHIVYRSAVENIADSQVQSQIDVLNKDYRRQNTNATNTPAEFQPFAADFEIEFCLAKIDPTGKATTGITRRATTYDNVSQSYALNGDLRVCHTALGGADGWNPAKYLNIWVAKIGSGILGFGTFPGSSQPDEDGIFIDPRYFGTTGLTLQYPPNHLGRTCTHEVGHFLDLYHIWGNDSESCTDDDGVGDTPKQRGPSSGCPVHPQLSCGVKTMFMNYMDYTSDNCMNSFTEGQKARARGTLQVARVGLMNSNICGSVPIFEPENLVEKISVFPNPTSGELTVRLPKSMGAVKNWQVFDVLGKKFTPTQSNLTDEFLSLDVENLPFGLLFFQLISENGSQTVSFLKN